MSVSVTLDGELITEIATTKGWGDFCRWVKGLKGEFPNLRHLITYGWEENLEKIYEQLRQAGKTNHPSADVKKIAEQLLDIVGDREEATVLTITDGTAP